MRERENRKRLKKETQKWEREVRKKEKRQAKVLDDLRWKGKKKFRTIKTKLQNKLKKIEKNVKPVLVSDAIKKNTSKWVISGDSFKDPVVFLENTTPAVGRLIISTSGVGKKVNTVLVCKMVKTNAATRENIITITHFRSKTHRMFTKENFETEYPINERKNVRKPR